MGTSNGTSSWAYFGVSALASFVCFVSFSFFAYVIQAEVNFSDYFSALLFYSAFLYLIMTASFVSIYNQFPKIDPIKSIIWITPIYIIGLVFLVGRYNEIIKEIMLSDFQYYTVLAVHVVGFLLFVFTFLLLTQQRQNSGGADEKTPLEPSTGGKAESVNRQLPYKTPESPIAIGFDEAPASLGIPAPRIPITKRPKQLGRAPPPTVSDLVELLSSRKSQLDELRGQYPKAGKAIEYLSEAKKAWEDIQDLPDNHIETFLEAMNGDPTCDPAEQAAAVKLAYEKELNPFETQEMNAAFAEARKIGRNAAREFLEVAGIFGDRLSPSDILEKINEKFHVQSPILYDLMNACKVFDHPKTEGSIRKLGFEIRFAKSDRGTKRYVIQNPETGREILRGNLANIKSNMLQNSKILKALRISEDDKKQLLRRMKIEENLGEALRLLDEKRIVSCVEALNFKVEISQQPGLQYYEITDPRSGSRTVVKDFVSLRRFAEKILQTPLDKNDTGK